MVLLPEGFPLEGAGDSGEVKANIPASEGLGNFKLLFVMSLCNGAEHSAVQIKSKAVCQMCSEPVLKCLVEPFDTVICLQMVESNPHLLDPFSLNDGSEVWQDELRAVTSGDGIGNANPVD